MHRRQNAFILAYARAEESKPRPATAEVPLLCSGGRRVREGKNQTVAFENLRAGVAGRTARG